MKKSIAYYKQKENQILKILLCLYNIQTILWKLHNTALARKIIMKIMNHFQLSISQSGHIFFFLFQCAINP